MRYFIAGPCAIESVDSFVAFADVLVRVFERYPSFKLVYKGSFDKANRTLAGSLRGVGLVEAEIAWAKIRSNHPSLMLTTDVHETWQCVPASLHCDVLQIPAMLGRQTSLIEAAAATGRIVNLKKPIWEGVDYFGQASTKTEEGYTWYTYRGSGTREHLVVDMFETIGLVDMHGSRDSFFDLTHTNREYPRASKVMARMLEPLHANYFAEVHPEPSKAISDSVHQLDTRDLKDLLGGLE